MRLDAKLRTGSDPVAMPFDAGLPAKAEIFNLVCPFGELDITCYPAGTGGYDDLIAAAATYQLDTGVVVQVASIDDIIRSKEAANRPKDREAPATLRLLRDELHRLADEE